MSDWKPGDVANGHVLGEDLEWRPVEESESAKPSSRKWRRRAIIAAVALVAIFVALIVVGILVYDEASAQATMAATSSDEA